MYRMRGFSLTAPPFVSLQIELHDVAKLTLHANPLQISVGVSPLRAFVMEHLCLKCKLCEVLVAVHLPFSLFVQLSSLQRHTPSSADHAILAKKSSNQTMKEMISFHSLSQVRLWERMKCWS